MIRTPLSCVGKNSALRNLIVFDCANIIKFNKQIAGIDSEKILAVLRYSKIEISSAVTKIKVSGLVIIFFNYQNYMSGLLNYMRGLKMFQIKINPISSTCE